MFVVVYLKQQLKWGLVFYLVQRTQPCPWGIRYSTALLQPPAVTLTFHSETASVLLVISTITIIPFETKSPLKIEFFYQIALNLTIKNFYSLVLVRTEDYQRIGREIETNQDWGLSG